MKKNIVLSDGSIIRMGIEQVLEHYNKQIRRTIINYIGFDAFEADKEDLMQEGEIQCWRAFETYNEENCFSTHLTWTIKGKLQALVKQKATQKRNNEEFQIVNIDSETSFDSNKTVQDYIADDRVHFEEEFTNKEMMKFILDNIDKNEHDLLMLNLGLKSVTEMANESGTSKANISYKNKRFKKKLASILQQYNTELQFNFA